MAEILAVEVTMGVTAHVVMEAVRVFNRQWRALKDPSKECAQLVNDIAIVERCVECADAHDDLDGFMEKVNFDVLKASNAVFEYRNLTGKQRFMNMKRLSRVMEQIHERLQSHISKFEDLLVKDRDFNLTRIKEEVDRATSKDYNERVEKRVAALVHDIETAVKAGDEDLAASRFFELSALVGEDATSTKHLQPTVRAFVGAKGLKTSQAQRPPWETGIESLGPLGVQHVKKLTADNVEITKPDVATSALAAISNLLPGEKSTAALPKYKVKLESARVAAFSAALGVSGPPSGSLSPMAKVTVDQVTRKALLIPAKAVYFSFVYPVDGLKDASLEDIGSPDHLELLLIHGGYMYFDSNTKFLSANCFNAGQNRNPFVCFSAPQRLDPTVVAALESQGRFTDVTAQSLADQGAERFAWVNPGEALGSANGECWKHGAFAYLCSDRSKNSIFSIASIADVLGLSEEAVLLSTRKRSSFKLAFGGGAPNGRPSAVYAPLLLTDGSKSAGDSAFGNLGNKGCCVIA